MLPYISLCLNAEVYQRFCPHGLLFHELWGGGAEETDPLRVGIIGGMM